MHEFMDHSKYTVLVRWLVTGFWSLAMHRVTSHDVTTSSCDVANNCPTCIWSFFETSPLSPNYSCFAANSYNPDNHLFEYLHQAVPRQCEQQKELMSEVISEGTTSHAVSLKRVITQYQDILDKPIEDSIFYQPIKTHLHKVKGKGLFLNQK